MSLVDVLDRMIDMAEVEHPGVEYVIRISEANSMFIPVDDESGQLPRFIEGRGAGCYRAMSYRDREIVTLAPDDWTVSLNALQGTMPEAVHAANYKADLRTGTLTKIDA